MAKTIVGSFDSFDEAQRVVHELNALGLASDDVNIVANDVKGQYSSSLTHNAARTDDTGRSTAADVGAGAVTGGVIGGTAGLVAALVGLSIPGIGPIVAAGPIAAALTGAGVGAVAGGLVGGLRHIGVPDEHADYYAESVRRGGALVTVRAEDTRATEIADLMRRHGAHDIDRRVEQWRNTGWSGYDASAKPMTYEEIEAERAAYRSYSAGTTGGTTGSAMGGTAGSTMSRVGDKIERMIPGDSDRDGK